MAPCFRVGQAIWAKGYTELLNLMERDARSQPDTTHVDCFGYGDDLDEVREWALSGTVVCVCGTVHSPAWLLANALHPIRPSQPASALPLQFAAGCSPESVHHRYKRETQQRVLQCLLGEGML